MTRRRLGVSTQWLSSLRGKWEQAFDRGQRYLSSLWWLLKFGLLSRRLQLLWLLGLASASLAAQALAVGAIFGFVHVMEDAAPIQFLDIQMEWLRSHVGLFAFVALVAVLLALNHLAIYRVRVLAIDWAGSTERRCGRLILSIATQLPDLARPQASARATDLGLRILVSADARYCGLTIRLMVMSCPAIVGLVGSIVGLLILDWAITCVMVALGAVIFLFQYPANVKGADASRRFQALRPGSVQHILATIESLRLGAMRPDVKVSPNRDVYSLPSVSGSIDAYGNRLRAIEIGTLVTQMGTTLLIAAIILFIGDRVFTGTTGWASLLAYVSLLRVASGNFSGVARQTTSIARLYPQVQDFVAFVKSYEKHKVPHALKTRNWAVRINAASNREESASGSAKASILCRRLPIAIVTVGNRLAARPDFALGLSSHIDPLTCENSGTAAETGHSADEVGTTLGAVVLVARGRMQTGASPRNILGLAKDMKQETWRAALEELRDIRPDLSREVDLCISADLDRSSGPIVQEERAGLVALAASALLRRASIIVLECDALQTLDCLTTEDPLFRRLHRDSLVAVWYQRDQTPDGPTLAFGEQTALVSVGATVEAIVDLTKSGARKHFAEKLESAAVKQRQATKSAGDDLDDIL